MKGDATTAQMFGKTFRNIFGWHVMRPSAMDKELYNDLYRMYVTDENKLGLQEYFDRVNPAAYQVMTAVMLESARKGYWKPTEEQLRITAELHAYNTEKHGAACTEVVCDNQKLQQFIAGKLASAQATEYNKSLKAIHEATNTNSNSVVLKQENLQGDVNEESKTINGIAIAVIVAVLLLMLVIWLKRRSGSRSTRH